MSSGMNAPKPCARCELKVYPLEQLKCLDKIWHKGCFKCTECQMPLSMKNYKGYNKFPYCDAHVPKPSFTTITDTPENRRLAENTANQSGILYHADFEKARGQKTSVVDDPETLRLMQNAQTVSNIGYHNLHDHKQEMETLRNRDGVDPGQQQQSFVSSAAGSIHGQPEEEARSSIEYQHAATPKMWQNGFPPMQPPGADRGLNKKTSNSSQSHTQQSHALPQPNNVQHPASNSHVHANNGRDNRIAQQLKVKPGSLADYDPMQQDRRPGPPSSSQQQQPISQPSAQQPGQRPGAPQGAPQKQQQPQTWQPQQSQQQQRPNGAGSGGYGGGSPTISQNQPPSYSQYQQQQQQNLPGQYQPPQQQQGYGQQQQPARPSFQTQTSGPKPYSPQPQAQPSSLYGQPQQQQPQPQSYNQQQSYSQQPAQQQQQQPRPGYGIPSGFGGQQQQQPSYVPAPQQQQQTYQPAQSQSQSQFGRQPSLTAVGNGNGSWPPKQSAEVGKAAPPWSSQGQGGGPGSQGYINQQTITQTTYSTQQSRGPAAPQAAKGGAKMFKAMYDYNAGDVDEVSFRDGDVILNVQPIDAGWMIGTVQRTGKSGMLPSNYVSPVN